MAMLYTTGEDLELYHLPSRLGNKQAAYRLFSCA